ncbi:MAG TPA: gliding motility-associated C-terminal domain-containing protein [Saprospiraceae bacterium]|nr:gliding motility-associated C-terminal domain-containing protein [Saprospiraceae bacterium]
MNVVQLLLAVALMWTAAPAEESAPSLNECEVYFPNAFSPNDDGINDEFKPAIANDCTFVSFEMNIYHKSGSLVFSSTDSTIGWNGRHRNQSAPADVYYYIAKYSVTANEDEIPEIITGDISLLR